MASERTVDSLPDEVLEFIFSKLTLPEKKAVRLVCKHWLKVSNSWSITRHEFVSLQMKHLHLFTTPRACLNIEIDTKIERVEFEKFEKFWVVHGGSVKTLILKIFDHQYPVINKVISHCSKVEDLTFQFYSGSLWPVNKNYNDGLKNTVSEPDSFDSLTNLTLMGFLPSDFLIGADFLKLLESVPNLKRLAVELNSKSALNDLSAKAIKSLIEKQALSLTELVLYDCGFADDAFFFNVFGRIGPQLTGLYLSGAPIQCMDSLVELSDKFPNLKNLELRNIFSVLESFSLESLNLTKIEFVSFCFLSPYTANVLPPDGLENLKGLDISYSGAADNILKCFEVKVFSNLIALKMCGLPITDNVLAKILPHLPNLKYLDLTNCKILSLRGVKAVIANCKQLTHLSLVRCRWLKNLKLSPSINSLENLIHLDLSNCSDLNPLTVLSFRFTQLKTLGLVGVSTFEGQLNVLFANCPKLTRLLLSSTILERFGRGQVIERIRNPRDIQFLNIFDFCT